MPQLLEPAQGFFTLGDFPVSDGFVNPCNKLINVRPKELLCIGLKGNLKLTIVIDVLETIMGAFFASVDRWFAATSISVSVSGKQKPYPWSIFAITFATLSNCVKPKMLKGVLAGDDSALLS